MSKRRNRKKSKPNIPQQTLDRARKDAGLIDDVPETEPPVPEVVDEPPASAVSAPPTETRRRAPPPAAQSSRRKPRHKEIPYEELSAEEITNLLDNPTKVVTKEQLGADYSYVLADLRSMGLLAAVLFIALIIVAGVFVI